MASLSHLFWIIFAFASAEQDSFPVGAETANFFNYELKKFNLRLSCVVVEAKIP
jgi:hypothetical protein